MKCLRNPIKLCHNIQGMGCYDISIWIIVSLMGKIFVSLIQPVLVWVCTWYQESTLVARTLQCGISWGNSSLILVPDMNKETWTNLDAVFFFKVDISFGKTSNLWQNLTFSEKIPCNKKLERTRNPHYFQQLVKLKN